MSIAVQAKITENLSKLSPKVEDAVVEAVVDREVKKRSQALVQALDKLSEMEKDLKKLGPDNLMYDENGKEVLGSYTKKRIDEKNKLTGRIQKLTNIINKALEKAEFNDLYNFVGGKEPADDQAKSAEKED